MTTHCNYLYGIVPAGPAKDFGPIGLDGEEVRIVADGGIGMVISSAQAVEFSQIPPEQTLGYLAQHQRVLERVMRDGDVVPVKFGTFCPDGPNDAEVARILRSGQREFAAALENYADKVEFDVAVSWADLKSVLEEIGRDESVVVMKTRIGTQAAATMEQRVRLGQLVKGLLEQKNEATAASLADSLRSQWRNLIVNPTRDDSAVLNAAVLIDRADETKFDAALEQLNRAFGDRLTFRRVGPLPPYSFATAEVKTVPASRLDEARQVLGLGDSASLTEIKATYRRLIQEVHPDRNAEAQAADRLGEISAAYGLLEEYALNFKHSFTADQANPVIVTVRSLDDLRVRSGQAAQRRWPARSDGAGTRAA